MTACARVRRTEMCNRRLQTTFILLAAGQEKEKAGVTEGLGTEINAIFTIDAPPVEHASIASASGGHDEEDETVAALVGGKSLWTARVSSRSAVRPGAPLELAVDTSRLHFFDPTSGESIGHPLSVAVPAAASA